MCRFIFFQFSQHQFLKRPISVPLSNISWLYLCDSIFVTFILFCWSFLSLIPFCLSYLNFSECHEVVLFECLNFPWYSHVYFRILPLLSNSESVCLYPQKSCAKNFFYWFWTEFINFKRKTCWQYCICLTIDMEHLPI